MAGSGDAIKYGFAVGRVMVLRTRLLSRASYERLLDAPTFAEQRRVLSETHYGRFIESATNASEVERAVDESLRDLYEDFLERSGLPPAVVSYFRAPYDFAALRGALKARALGARAHTPSVLLGCVASDGFDEPASLPGALGRTAREVLEADDELDGAAIDATVDRAMFAELAHLARESGSGFLEELIKLQIDIANVKSLLRARLADVPADEALPMTVEGGSVSVAELTRLYELPIAEAGARLAALPTLSGIPAAELADLGRLDVTADNVVVGYLRRARAVSVGAEPVIAYVMGREAEVRAVRTLLIGRLAGLPTEVLRSRLRNLYV